MPLNIIYLWLSMAKKSPQRVPHSAGSPGQIRIIGGQWRGRKLPVPLRPGLRPTTDPVRETLFNWLAPVIRQAHCLDAFAGSGALGLEALSRYAASATLLEYDRSVAQQLTQNLLLLNVNQEKTNQGRVIATDTLQWLTQQTVEQPFDIVFIDPPFRQGLLTSTLQLLEQRGWLAEEAWIYVEAEVEHTALDIPANWLLHREKVAGQVAYRLYIRQPEQL